MRTELSASLKYSYPVIVRITSFVGITLLILTFLVFPRVVNRVELDEEVQIIIEQIDIPQTEQFDRPPPPARPSVPVESESEETDDDLDEEESNSENEELDIGSYVGVDIDGEEYYGTIVEFDDDEETVTIEEEESGDEITAYQDEMFVPED